MELNQENSLISSKIMQVTREVITAAYRANSDRPSSKAILAFAVRLAGSWKSTVTLVKHHPEQNDLRAVANDCAGIRRCMYDAFLQMKWIALGPNDPDEMGQLYLGFKTVENYKLMEIVLSQTDYMSKRVADSPLRTQGQASLKKDYDMAKLDYPRAKGGGVRNHWYPGTLDNLAKDLGATEEYT